MQKDLEIESIKAMMAFNYNRVLHIVYGDCSHKSKLERKKVKKLIALNSKKEDINSNDVYASKIIVQEPNRKYSLYHYFDCKAHLKQIKVHAPKLLYALYQCGDKQVVTAWNYLKSYCIMNVDGSAIYQFDICPITPALLACAAHNHIYCLQFNFTNKIYKELPTNIEMKLEKSNDFISVGYIPKSEWWIVISNTNNVFIMNQLSCAFQIVNFTVNISNISPAKNDDLESEEMSADSVELDSMQRLASNAGLIQLLAEVNPKTGLSDEDLQDIDSHREFMSLHISKKEFLIGTKGGYLLAFEFDTTKNPIHKYTAKVMKDVYYIDSITTNTESSMIGCVVVYPMRKLLKNNFDQKNKYDKIYDFIWVQRSHIEDHASNPTFTRILSSAYDPEEIVDIRSTSFKKEFSTASNNNSIVIWGFIDKWQQFAKFYLDGKPISMDFHPSSLMIAIGFKKYIKIFAILSGKMSLLATQEIPSLIKIRYCTGGAFLAAADKLLIYIMKSHNLQVVGYIRGPLGAELKDFYWASSSKPLVAYYSTGDILLYYIEDFTDVHFKRSLFLNIKQNLVGCCLVAEKFITAITPTHLKIYTKTSECLYEEELNYEPCIIKYLDDHKTIIVGFKKGFIRMYNWPILKNCNDFYDCIIDSCEIKGIELFDEKYLLISTITGHIFCAAIMKIKNLEKQRKKLTNADINIKNIEGINADSIEYNELNIMQKLLYSINEGKAMLNNMTNVINTMKEQKENSLQKKLMDIHKKNNNQLDEEQSKYDNLIKLQDMEYQETVDKIAQNEKESMEKLESMKREYENRIGKYVIRKPDRKK